MISLKLVRPNHKLVNAIKNVTSLITGYFMKNVILRWDLNSKWELDIIK